MKSDADEEIAHIDWYPSGKIKRIYRTGSSTLPDVYFEYDAMGMRSLKVEMTRTGTTIDASDQWNYTYYACDANGIAMAIYDLDQVPATDELKRIEAMIYGGSRVGMQVEEVDVELEADLEDKCNTDGLAHAVIQFGPTAFAVATDDLDIYINGTVAASITWDGDPTEDQLQELVDQINADAVGYYAYLIDLGSGTWYMMLEETVAGSLTSGTEATFEYYRNSTVQTAMTKRQITIGDCYADRTLGQKFYELTNHLGNVMEVISDRKIAKDDVGTPDGTIDYYEADIVSWSEYYPFGMELPGRNGTIAGGDYRYAFNGMETDKEVSADGNGKNSYTTQFRQYDPRLGRWKSLDPLAAQFPWQSPFCGMDNNPIALNDPSGLATEGGDGDDGGGVSGSGKKGDPYVIDGMFDESDLESLDTDQAKKGVYASDDKYNYYITYSDNGGWKVNILSKSSKGGESNHRPPNKKPEGSKQSGDAGDVAVTGGNPSSENSQGKGNSDPNSIPEIPYKDIVDYEGMFLSSYSQLGTFDEAQKMLSEGYISITAYNKELIVNINKKHSPKVDKRISQAVENLVKDATFNKKLLSTVKVGGAVFGGLSLYLELDEYIDNPTVENGIDVGVSSYMAIESVVSLAGRSTGPWGLIIYGTWQMIPKPGDASYKFYNSLPKEDQWDNHWGLTWEGEDN